MGHNPKYSQTILQANKPYCHTVNSVHAIMLICYASMMLKYCNRQKVVKMVYRRQKPNTSVKETCSELNSKRNTLNRRDNEVFIRCFNRLQKMHKHTEK